MTQGRVGRSIPPGLAGLLSFIIDILGVPCLTLRPTAKICSSLVERKVEISVLGLIDAMGVLPVALFITVLYSTNQL